MADEIEELEEENLTILKLKKLCVEYLNYNEPPVEAMGYKELAGAFLKSHNREEFEKRLQEYIDKLVEAGVVIKGLSTNINRMYKFSTDRESHMALFKYVK